MSDAATATGVVASTAGCGGGAATGSSNVNRKKYLILQNIENCFKNKYVRKRFLVAEHLINLEELFDNAESDIKDIVNNNTGIDIRRLQISLCIVLSKLLPDGREELSDFFITSHIHPINLNSIENIISILKDELIEKLEKEIHSVEGSGYIIEYIKFVDFTFLKTVFRKKNTFRKFVIIQNIAEAPKK